ncbi:hypothetical protein [Streptomyces sp. NPDC051098]|uniref:hypothetical protein n=1 Tax=Streptomyces sp. NPDC051098 TaxID=3155411 RepID=UPI0034401ADA
MSHAVRLPHHRVSKGLGREIVNAAARAGHQVVAGPGNPKPLDGWSPHAEQRRDLLPRDRIARLLPRPAPWGRAHEGGLTPDGRTMAYNALSLLTQLAQA